MRLVTVLSTCVAVIAAPLVAQEGDLLITEDIAPIMKEMFQYHVDQKQFSEEIISRSFKVYIDQFDPSKTYLLAADVEQYIDPSPRLVRQVLRQVNGGDYSVYDKLNTLFQKAIRRSRGWREELEANPDEWTSQSDDDEVDEEDLPFAAKERELKTRIRRQLAAFATYQQALLGEGELAGKEDKLVALYERNVRSDENRYLYRGDDGEKLTKTKAEHYLSLHILRAMARSLDAHSSFFSYAEAYDMKVRLEKNFPGVGIVLQEGIDGVTITRVIEGGPAFRSEQLEEQDRIVSVDGRSIVNLPFDSVLDRIRGTHGSVVTLGIKRVVEDEPVTFDLRLVREQIELDDNRVESDYTQFGDGIIGKIALHSFYDGDNGVSSVRDVRNAIRDLYKQGDLKGLVLDLRDNTGGFLMQAVKVAGLFVSNGVIVVSKYGDDEIRYFRDIDGHAYFEGPLVVLISRGSASAAEIVAQALQDYGSAIVVGDEESYGKGTIQHQTVTDSNHSSYFKVTVGRYYTVSGDSTQIDGVHADIVVPTEINQEKMGEKYLDYPLETDEIPASFNDQLTDLNPEARRWYNRYYTPTIQQKMMIWRDMLPVLRENSAHRLKNDDNYQEFLEKIGIATLEEEVDEDMEMVEDDPDDSDNYGLEDMQLSEAYEIVRDMAVLSSP
jgi:carboxyl-terminal processing protease